MTIQGTVRNCVSGVHHHHDMNTVLKLLLRAETAVPRQSEVNSNHALVGVRVLHRATRNFWYHSHPLGRTLDQVDACSQTNDAKFCDDTEAEPKMIFVWASTSRRIYYDKGFDILVTHESHKTDNNNNNTTRYNTTRRFRCMWMIAQHKYETNGYK